MEMNDEPQYRINYSHVVGEKNLLSITKLLASSMMNSAYMTIGDFLKGISDSDLQTLLDIIDEGDGSPGFEDIMLISGMLADGEGVSCKNVEDYQKCVNMFMTYVAMESLYRKGMIKLHRQNMSFGDDMGDSIVAEKLDD